MSTTDRYQCVNFDIPGLKSALKRGTKIENLGLNGAGELYGTCGSLDRYPIAVYSNINDINYAKIYIRSVKNKYGKVKIIANLRQKGVSDKDIDEVMQEFESDTDSIMALAQKYMKNKEVNQDNISKLYRHLLSKGFDYDEVNSVVREIKEKLC